MSVRYLFTLRSLALAILGFCPFGCIALVNEPPPNREMVAELGGLQSATEELSKVLQRSQVPQYEEADVSKERFLFYPKNAQGAVDHWQVKDVTGINVYANSMVHMIGAHGGVIKPILFQSVDDAIRFRDLVVSIRAHHGFGAPSVFETGAQGTIVDAVETGATEEKIAEETVAKTIEKPLVTPSDPVPGKSEDGPTTYSKAHAIIIGISTYRDPSFTRLDKARKDAEALAKYLRSPEGGNLPSRQVHLLVDSQASRAEILEMIREIGRKTNPDDLLFVFFACHGHASTGNTSDRFLIPYDGRPRSEDSNIRKSTLAKRLDEARAKHQIVLMDSCFASDGITRDPNIREDQPFASLADETNGTRVVLTSNKGREFSWEGDARKPHSPFAGAVLNALKESQANEGGSPLTVGELYERIRSQVSEDSKGLMNPQKHGTSRLDNLVLFPAEDG